MNLDMSSLIYTTVGKSKDYLQCLITFCDSLVNYNKNLNLLVITDESFRSEVDDIVAGYDITYYYLERPNSETPEIASMHKLDIHDFIELNKFINILYVDLDCIFQGDINKILNNTLEDNRLYVMPENKNMESHTHNYWSLQNYTGEDINFFTTNNIYVFNAGCFLFKNTNAMKEHFLKLKKIIQNHTGNFFYEQSFMNVYFNKLNIIDYTIITNDLYRLEFSNPTDSLPELIVHFCGGPGLGLPKIERINSYYRI
jgi:lipopolysaccharide biosynthesis glycosyltransferase